jgi:hypothetical protein
MANYDCAVLPERKTTDRCGRFKIGVRDLSQRNTVLVGTSGQAEPPGASIIPDLFGDEISGVLQGVKPRRDDADSRRPNGPSVSVPISPRPDPATA